jgi:hypothetical protein
MKRRKRWKGKAELPVTWSYAVTNSPDVSEFVAATAEPEAGAAAAAEAAAAAVAVTVGAAAVSELAIGAAHFERCSFAEGMSVKAV